MSVIKNNTIRRVRATCCDACGRPHNAESRIYMALGDLEPHSAGELGELLGETTSVTNLHSSLYRLTNSGRIWRLPKRVAGSSQRFVYVLPELAPRP